MRQLLNESLISGELLTKAFHMTGVLRTGERWLVRLQESMFLVVFHS